MSGTHKPRPTGLSLVALFAAAMLAAQAHAGTLSFSVDLRTGAADRPPAPYIAFKDVPVDANHDGWYETVLRINLNDPKIGNPYNVVEFQVEYDAEPAGQVNLNIGDSRTNDSGGGDSGTQSNDAEINIGNDEGHGTDLYIFGKDGTPTPGNLLECVPGFVANGVVARLTIGNQHISWTNNRGKCGSLSSPQLFALAGQPDSEGQVNYEIYAAFNRVIAGPRRFGSGVKQVTVILSSNSNDAAGRASDRQPVGEAKSSRIPAVSTPSTVRAADTLSVSEAKSIRLPAVADHVLAAGGGRYLLLQFPTLVKLGVYDLTHDNITGYIPLPSNNTVVACSLHNIVVLATDKRVIQRWNIEPLRKELTVALDVPEQIEGITMGYASEGPILATTSRGPRFVSLQTLKPMGLPTEGRGDWSGRVIGVASADGQTFAGWARGVSPTGVRRLQIQGDKLVARYDHASAGVLLPSWDGTYLFGYQNIYDSDLHLVGGDRFRGTLLVPALHPAYFIAIPMPDRFQLRNRNASYNPAIYTVADRTKLLDLDPLTELQPESRSSGMGYGEDLSMHERMFFVPQHGRLVTLAHSRDRLVSRGFDIIAALNRVGIDYLFVDSVPPLIAKPGGAYRYRLQVKSKTGGVKFTLDSGPEGMTLSKDGLIRWDVPADIEAGQHGVIITVEDASGQTLLHSFTIRTEGAGPTLRRR
jgi:hypothetical protein